MPAQISIIAAIAKHNAIGVQNTMPWRLPEDLAHFKRTTRGHSVLMGRNTFLSLGRPLPERNNIVITRDADFKPDHCIVAHSLEEAITQCHNEAEAFIIGGAQIYQQALPLAHRLYLTEIDLDVPDADAFFPDIDWSAWQEISRTASHSTENQCDYAFVTYQRK